MIKITCLRINIFTLLILFIFIKNGFAQWIEPPYFDIYNELPEFSYDWTSLSQLEQFRLDIEKYRKEELEEYNKKIEIFNKSIQGELKTIENERRNKRITIEEYNKKIEEYRHIINVIYNECITTYKEGLSVYRSRIFLYKKAVNQILKYGYIQKEMPPPAAFPFREIKITTKLTKSDIKKIILEYINNYYTRRNGFIQLTASEDEYVHIYISKVRDEIIKGKRLWEKIQIAIDYYEVNSILTIHGFIDGWFAPGFNPPSEESGYYDIELRYPEQLRIYSDEWFLGLKEYIQKKENEKKKFKICIFNKVSYEYFSLYVNDFLVREVPNGRGDKTCNKIELKNGINKIRLQHYKGRRYWYYPIVMTILLSQYDIEFKGYFYQWKDDISEFNLFIHKKENENNLEMCIYPLYFFKQLYVNDLLIGDIHGDKTCNKIELKNGINKIRLQHYKGRRYWPLIIISHFNLEEYYYDWNFDEIILLK